MGRRDISVFVPPQMDMRPPLAFAPRREQPEPRRRIAQVQIAPLAGTEYRWRYDDDTTSAWYAAPDKGMLSAPPRARACEWRPKPAPEPGKTPV